MKKFTVVICNPTEPIGLGQKVYGGVVSAAYDRELTDEKPAVAHPPAVAVNEHFQPYTSEKMKGRFAFQPKHIGGWLVDQQTGRTYEPSFAKEYALAMLDSIAAAEAARGRE